MIKWKKIDNIKNSGIFRDWYKRIFTYKSLTITSMSYGKDSFKVLSYGSSIVLLLSKPRHQHAYTLSQKAKFSCSIFKVGRILQIGHCAFSFSMLKGEVKHKCLIHTHKSNKKSST